MCANLFPISNKVSSFRRVKERSREGINLIIVPEIINAEVFFPSVRFANIKAEIAVRYSF